MARKRNPNRDKAYELWLEYKERPLVDIAKELGERPSTVRKWKSQDNWERSDSKESAPIKKGRSVAVNDPPNDIVNDGTEDITDVLEYYGITEQQRRFADNFIETGIIEKSALDAGYSNNYARAGSYKLLAIIGVKKYIDDRMRVLSAGRVATQEEILQGLTRIFSRQEDEHTVVTLRSKTEQWVPTGDEGVLKKMVVETEEPQVVAFPGKISDSIKAADLLLKRLDLSKKQGTDTNITIVDAWLE
jgi:phage terminase small subunit